MSVLSKILNPEWTVPYNCYELGHTWSPSCSESAFELLCFSFVEALKVYTPLYVASQIVFSRKQNIETFTETLKSIIRSSCFLSANVFLLPLSLCLFRQIAGNFYYRFDNSFAPFTAAMLAILIEKPSRRFPLAIYVANIASECLFRLAVEFGYIRSIPKGEVLIFTASMSALLFLIKKQGYGQDPISLVLRYYLGKGEAAVRSRKPPNQIMKSAEERDNNFNLKGSLSKDPLSLLKHKHMSCSHDESACLSYAAAGFAKPFLICWFGSSMMAALKKYNKVLKDPSQLVGHFLNRRSLSVALFFGSFSGIYKAANCLLRHHSDGVEDWHAVVAGLLAGPTMLFHPNSTITLYVLWKLIETLYWKGEKAGYCKNPVMTANVVYSASVVQILYCLLLQPKQIRPSYMRFIDQLTGHRFQTINRLPFNVLVPNASKGYEDFFPDLDPKFMSNKFVESIFIWLI